MFKIPARIKITNPELLFVTYYWGFMLLRPLLDAYKTHSTLILFIYVLCLLVFFIVGMILRKEHSIGQSVLLLMVLFLFFLGDIVLRHNSFSFEYVYRFVYSGILPVLFLSKVRNGDLLLKYFTWFSLIIFLLYGADPLTGYKVFSDYMDYGFNLAMPAFFGLFLGYHYFKMRWMLIFEILCFLSILIFANRSALLGVLFFTAFYFLFMSADRKRIFIRWILPITIAVIIISFNIDSILKFIYNEVLIKLGYNSYALSKFTSSLTKLDLHVLFSGRMEIWTKALNMIRESPLIGHGLGSFQARYGFYSHNIILDILIFYGLLGFLIFGFLILASLYKIWRSKTSVKLIGFLFLSLWFPKLFFSAYFMEDFGFWCFIAFSFFSLEQHNRISPRLNKSNT